MCTIIFILGCLIIGGIKDEATGAVLCYLFFWIPICIDVWIFSAHHKNKQQEKFNKRQEELSLLKAERNEQNRLGYLKLKEIQQFDKILINTEIYLTKDIKSIAVDTGTQKIKYITFDNFSIHIEPETFIKYL